MEEPRPLVEFEDSARDPESLMEQLRARRTEIADTKEILLPIAGYEEHGLQVMHRLFERPELTAMAKRIARETKNREERNVRLAFDTVIQSTTGFYIQRSEDPEPVHLEDENGEPMERWDQMARFVGWQPTGEGTARAALMYVFGGNEFAVGQHSINLSRWMSNTGVEVDVELLGEAG